MPIQTSSITTEQDGNLSLDPAGTGKVVLTDEIGAVKPLGLNASGEVGELNTDGLQVLPGGEAEDSDLLLIQRAGVQYKVAASDIGGGTTAANPDPSDVTAVPPFDSGSGTQADPYVFTPVVVNAPGDSAQTVQLVTISNQPSLAIGIFDDLTAGSGARFTQSIAQFNAAGVWTGRLNYLDTPESTSGAIFNGSLKMGSATVYFAWDVTQVADQTVFSPAASPTASPADVNYAFDNKYGTVTGAYIDTPGVLTATGAARFTVDGSSATSSASITSQQQLGVLFDAATIDAAVQGTSVSGTITGPSGFLLTPSIVVDRNADAFTPEPLSNATASSAATSGNVSITGINCKSFVTLGAATLTTVQASINGAIYAAIPASGTTMPINPGDTLRLRGTTGGTASTAYTAQIRVGTTVGTWSVTNSAPTANIAQPTITSPVDGSANIVPDINVLSSAYVANNGAGAHTSSDWQVYQANSAVGPPTTEPPNPAVYAAVVNAVADTTNLVSYPLTEAQLSPGKAYYARVRYNDNGGVVSPYSGYGEFLTKDSFVPDPGEEMEGGYFAGQINDGGTIYNLIICPLSQAGLVGGFTDSVISWKLNDSNTSDPVALNQVYGAPATTTYGSSSNYQLFNWCVNVSSGPNRGAYDATNSLGTGIGGKNDWYIPAFYELQIVYRNLKPTNNSNDTSQGINPYSVPPSTSNFTASDPARTSVTIFQEGGTEALTIGDRTWTANQDPSDDGRAIRPNLSSFVYNTGGKGTDNAARAIRRVPA